MLSTLSKVTIKVNVVVSFNTLLNCAHYLDYSLTINVNINGLASRWTMSIEEWAFKPLCSQARLSVGGRRSLWWRAVAIRLGYETVQAECEQYEEEEHGQELRHRQVTHHRRIDDERQRRSCSTDNNTLYYRSWERPYYFHWSLWAGVTLACFAMCPWWVANYIMVTCITLSTCMYNFITFALN